MFFYKGKNLTSLCPTCYFLIDSLSGEDSYMVQSRPEASFVADMMLGKLARWMRVLGYDVLYLNPVDDTTLLNIAREENRILITRDTRLIKRRGVGEHLLILNNDPMEQLKEVVRLYPPVSERMLSRCIRCNAPLIPAVREDVRDKIPEYVYLTSSQFGRCSECGRVFWPGTHYHQMVKTCRKMVRGGKK